MPNKGGQLRILQKNKLAEGELQALYKQVIHNPSLVLNDPERALEFVAVWDQED